MAFKFAERVFAFFGTLLFSKEGQSLNLTYSDTGFLPTELSLSAFRAELERR